METWKLESPTNPLCPFTTRPWLQGHLLGIGLIKMFCICSGKGSTFFLSSILSWIPRAHTDRIDSLSSFKPSSDHTWFGCPHSFIAILIMLVLAPLFYCLFTRPLWLPSNLSNSFMFFMLVVESLLFSAAGT